MAHDPNRVRVRFTKEHEDRGVLYQPGQEAEVCAASAGYIEQVAKSGHRVTDTPAVAEPKQGEPKQRAGRATEE